MLLVLFQVFVGCQNNSSDNSKPEHGRTAPVEGEAQMKDKAEVKTGCSTEEAMKIILALEEVEESKRNLDSLTDHKANISFIVDSLKQGERELYSLTVGYNSEVRFEPYYHFYVNKSDCKDIQIMDIVSGEYLPIASWRKQTKDGAE